MVGKDHVQQRNVLLNSKLLSGLCLLCAVVGAELLLEPLNTAGRIDKLLLAGKERVAIRANFSVDRLGGTACFKRISATAVHHDLFVFRMYSFFHSQFSEWDKKVIVPTYPKISTIIFVMFINYYLERTYDICSSLFMAWFNSGEHFLCGQQCITALKEPYI
jgi:hypothetical protein